MQQVFSPSAMGSHVNAGAPGAHPDLRVKLTMASATGGQPSPAGRVRVGLDVRQLDAAALTYLAAAPKGTNIGRASLMIAGRDDRWSGLGLHVTSSSKDAKGKPIVYGYMSVPEALRQPGVAFPFTISQQGQRVVFELGMQVARQKLAVAGINFIPTELRLTLPGLWRTAGKTYALTVNPASPTQLSTTASMRACTNSQCSALKAATSAIARIELPKAVGLTAPQSATYARVKNGFSGIRFPGDQLELWQKYATSDYLPVRNAAISTQERTSFLARAPLRTSSTTTAP